MKLADQFLAVIGAGQIGCIVIRRETIDDETVVEISLTGNGQKGWERAQ